MLYLLVCRTKAKICKCSFHLLLSFVLLSFDWNCQGDGKVKFCCQTISATFVLVQIFVDEKFLSENRKAFYSILLIISLLHLNYIENECRS